ncbi:sulfotransferase [Ilumatobacter nonamiensis]|uniref:sulfotransferase n=1 Tax=Ilumatobacter nonamiensis TaxID=467093 RepID=UPI000348D930|nr:sulfotransferase [Ilumatobacter nonamiensis]
MVPPTTTPERLLILGTPRSGTTWTSEIVGTAPGARLVHEPDNEVNDPFALLAKVGLGRFPVLESVAQCPDAYRQLWRAAFEHGGSPDTLRARAANTLLTRSPRPIRDEILSGRPSRRGRVLQFGLERLAEPRSASATAPLTVVKSVHALFAADMVVELAAPTVVVIRRHPLSVLSSWIEFDWPPQGLENDPEKVRLAGLENVAPFAATTHDERRAISYAILHRRVDRLLAENPSWHVADHDCICGDPLEEFRSLFDRLGLEWCPATEAAVRQSDTPGTGYDTQRVASEQIDVWRRRLDDDQIRALTAVLTHYGVAL